MTLGFLFWLLMVIWFIFGGYVAWPKDGQMNRALVGGNLLLFALLFILGWQVFGFVIQK